MPTPLHDIIDEYRNTARSEKQTDAYFERLTKGWVETAAAQREQLARVLT